jgi:hypothetical protein
MAAYLRRPQDHHARDSSPLAGQKLAELKKRIRKSPVRTVEYDTPAELGEYVLDDLQIMLDAVVKAHRGLNAADALVDVERESHDFFSTKMGQFFVAGGRYIDFIKAHFGYVTAEPSGRKHKLGTVLSFTPSLFVHRLR